MKYVLLLMVLFLAACNGGNGSNDANNANNETVIPAATVNDTTDPEPAGADATVPVVTTETPDSAETNQTFDFTLGNTTIVMGMDMADVINLLGEPISIFEIPSCAFEGTDRVFLFPGVQIHTIPIDGDDFIHTISLRDDTVATQNGIFLGSSLDSLINAYGDEYTRDFDMLTFTLGFTSLSFLINDNMVASIIYELDVAYFGM